MNKEQISKIVREVLKEKGLLAGPAGKPTSKRIQRPCPFPAVLNVFHPGVRYLELALEQVRLIEAMAGKSSVFAVSSARDWVCGQDVKDKSGCKCILDTVKPEGLAKTLQKADILVLPTFCFKTAAKAARLIDDSQETAIVISALMQSKPVLAANDGFTLLNTLSNEAIRAEIKRILAKLESFGMVFSQTDQLAATFRKMMSKRDSPIHLAPQKDTLNPAASAARLVTAKDIRRAADENQKSIALAPRGIITPLARDQAKEYDIRIVRTP